MFELRPTPINVTQQAARKLPRWILLALLFMFIVPGLSGHDVWTGRMADAFAHMWEMSTADFSSWLFPITAGSVITDHGPLSTWLGALFIKLSAGHLNAMTAARLCAVFWFFLATASIWYGTWFLARRYEAQPIAEMFEAKASYRDFGRLVSDAATLFFVSLFGLVVWHHEPSYETAQVALACLAYFACAWSLTRPYYGAALAGLASAGVMMTGSLLSGITVLLGCLLVHVSFHFSGRSNKKIFVCVGSAALCLSLWPVLAFLFAREVAGDYFSLWAQSQAAIFGIINLSEVIWFIQHTLWYLCPVWPFAIYALWMWRRQLSITYIGLPCAFLTAWVIGFVFSDNIAGEDLLSTTIAPLCTLAAFGLMSARRSLHSMFDGFSLTVFSLALLGVWGYWIALLLGTPPKMVHSVLALAPGFQALDASRWGIFFAAAATVFWISLIYPRLRIRPKVLWNGPWLAAVGLSVLWLCSVELFGPAIDINRSYAPVAASVRSSLLQMGYVPQDDCVNASTLPVGVRSLMNYYGNIDATKIASMRCRFELIQLEKSEVNLSRSAIYQRPRSSEVFVLRRLDTIH